jgi:hypothetical protein
MVAAAGGSDIDPPVLSLMSSTGVSVNHPLRSVVQVDDTVLVGPGGRQRLVYVNSAHFSLSPSLRSLLAVQ